MKKIKILTLTLVGLLAFSCTHHETTETNTVNKEEVAAELSSTWAAFTDAWEKGDVEACLSYMDEDYINMPSLEATTDFTATGEMFTAVFENNIIESAQVRPIELYVHDDMAFEFTYMDQVWINKSTEDTSQFTNRCLSVWKKMEDGNWKLLRWMAQ
jgi:ketosteroid isomerase-like protein